MKNETKSSTDINGITVQDAIEVTGSVSNPKVDLNAMTTKELSNYVASQKKKEAAKYEKEKMKYVSERDAAIESIKAGVMNIQDQLVEYKKDVHRIMEDQAQKLAKYGKIASSSKGGFSITNSEDNFRITRRRDTEPKWDERSAKAVDLLKEFLYDTVKKKAAKEFGILISFLERNKQGDLEYSKVMVLLNHEDKYQDERWQEGLRLLKESYHVALKGFGFVFQTRDEQGNWEAISLNFSRL